jgi:lipoprotein-releasing system ATP-binding protein
MIHITDVRKSYTSGRGATLDVLRGVSARVAPGEICAIVGSSGAGKSTLLHILGALDRPSAGSVRIDGQDLFALPDAPLAAFRNAHMGFVFQFHHLLPEFSALENVMMPALIGGSTTAAAESSARELLARVGVEQRSGARPAELSGGEQQRVAVARALVNAPKVVLADEPSGNLDEENAASLQELLWSLSRERQQTFVIVTHDLALAGRADSVYRLHDGVLLPSGAGAEREGAA